MCSRREHLVALDAIDLSIDRVAQPRGTLGNRVQHRLNVRRRTGDDAQDLARRGLLLQASVSPVRLAVP